MNPFEAYAKRANTVVNAPPPMLGPIKTRAAARERYNEIVAEMACCPSAPELEAYLQTNKSEIAQFASALEFLWLGSDDFPGLEREIALAKARVDAGLDIPRWEPRQTENGNSK